MFWTCQKMLVLRGFGPHLRTSPYGDPIENSTPKNVHHAKTNVHHKMHLDNNGFFNVFWKEAPNTLAASNHRIDSNIICAERINELGLAIFLPAIDGAVPCVASKIMVESDRLAPGEIPIPPTWAANASEI